MRLFLIALLIAISYAQTGRKSYQPDLPAPEQTPEPFWDGTGFIQALLTSQCPPWLPDMAPGKGGCQRDSVNLAVRFLRPTNRCGPGGRCPSGGEYASCVMFNKLQWYPAYTQSGFCITTRPQGGGAHNIAYVEKVTAVNPSTAEFYLKAMVWAQTDSPGRVMCDSFCKRCDRSAEYCADDDQTPIASGEFGQCECFCRSGTLAADFDRCTTVSEKICSAQTYCGGNGRPIFTQTKGPGEGTCACTCNSGFYGRNCEFQEGTLCDINDCNHRTYSVSGTRPNCQCDCGSGKFNFNADPTCKDWTWNDRHGTLPTASSNFTIQRQTEGRCWGGCKTPAQEGEECACTNPSGNWCSRFYRGGNGCIGDTDVFAGPEQYVKNRLGLECVTESDGRAICRQTDNPNPVSPDSPTHTCVPPVDQEFSITDEHGYTYRVTNSEAFQGSNSLGKGSFASASYTGGACCGRRGRGPCREASVTFDHTSDCQSVATEISTCKYQLKLCYPCSAPNSDALKLAETQRNEEKDAGGASLAWLGVLLSFALVSCLGLGVFLVRRYRAKAQSDCYVHLAFT